jgi:transglutaminase-like putative cysteine protease
MSRTLLCVFTAALVAAASAGLMAARSRVLGDEVRRPAGPNTWTVTLVVRGSGTGGGRLVTDTPLDLERQRVLDDAYESAQLFHKPPEVRRPDRRQVLWTRRAGMPEGPFEVRCRFHIAIDGGGHAGSAAHPAGATYAPPRPGEYLETLPGAEDERLSAAARAVTADLEAARNHRDIAEALYRFVAGDVRNEPHFDGPSAPPVSCLLARRGDRLAKARLLVALLRNRGLPARLVSGVTLARGCEQRTHYWVEAWAYGHWLPMCPFHGYFGRVPPTYLVFGFGDRPLARGNRIKDLDCAFLTERVGTAEGAAAGASLGQRLFRSLSLVLLPPAERRLVELLLLFPVAALIICVFRNLIGLSSFGLFAPALIGLAFHDLHSLPGILVFVTILLIGWLMRRILDHYHLLQVPRVAVMLTLIMLVLIAAVVASNRWGVPVTRYVALFPVVILTGMVERFWTLETEDSTAASFKTLLQTMGIATVIALVLSRPALARTLFFYPEALGLILAAQLLIGRYTGYRLTELFRFRDFLRPPQERPGYTVALEP